MASTAGEASSNTAEPNSPRRQGGGRGRSGRGGPRDEASGSEQGRGGGGRGRGRSGRGGGRGRGRGGFQATSQTQNQDLSSAQLPPQPGGRGGFGARLTKAADTTSLGDSRQNVGIAAATANTNGQPAQGADEDDDDMEVCFICASPVAHYSVAPCNHRTCHICSLRLRALYKTKACAHCRTEAASVVFTDEAEKRYNDYTPQDFVKTDNNLGISYEKNEIFEDTVLLLRYNCPDPSCEVACMGWPDLHRHVRSVHQKVMCDLCTRNKKVFTHEHELFTHAELKRHEKFGDDNPGAVDQSGFKGHPECGFCRMRFYGDDELFAHCRDKHERCHLCDRRTGGNNPRYFVNYDALEQHFGKDHHPCLDKECLEQKFVVFESEMDLKAHQLEKHPNGLSKDARRDARRVDLSSFDYRPQYQEERRPQRGSRRAGRGRDPNADGMPASTGGHMTRAELAHQRAREIQSAQSVSTRSFGGQLTQGDSTSVQAQPSTQQPQQPSSVPAEPSPASEPPLESLPPAERARRLRHAAVSERAANLLRNEKAKLDEFRERISSYKSDSISAAELIDAFFSLFDTSSSELGKLVKELADIFEIPGKKDNLLSAWNSWRAINEDYPSLPGPSGANATSAVAGLGANVGANRVLKLKSSTARSGRAAASGSGKNPAWSAAAAGPHANVGTKAGSSYASASPFPSLPPSKSSNQSQTGGSGWLALRPAGAITPFSSGANSRTASSQNLPKVNARDAFPSLPAAKKPTSTVFSPGYTGAGVIRTSGSNTPTNAWNSRGGAPNADAVNAQLEDVADDAAGGKKGGKGRKGKQVMFQWG
ncbi:hypothetical protein K431DRAFT_288778 [Polychaeton citri CBS 116435]|uniref:RING-type E3 ubiquitin transferase n=1 Tax=Polychaeton citri CBS 116435 TaxID=1314669 RepID=A0A9P4ULC5_9PEZI|nr:hypothetical protein K431DRAFT_288778 [Polychaeton citri CBS 116435]